MRFVSVREAKAQLSECLERSQREGVVVTSHGRPAAVIVGVEGYEAEEILLMLNPDFWRMIERRRKEPRTTLEELEAELETKPRSRGKRRAG